MRHLFHALILGLWVCAAGALAQSLGDLELQTRARTQVLIEEALAGSSGTSAYVSAQLADKFKAWARSNPTVVCSSYQVLSDTDVLFLVEQQGQFRLIRLDFIVSGRYSDGRVRRRIQRMHIGPWVPRLALAMDLKLPLGGVPVWKEGAMGSRPFATQVSTPSRFSMGATKPASTSVVTLDSALPVGQTKTLVESLDAQEADQIMDFVIAVVQGRQEDALRFFPKRRQGLSWWQQEGAAVKARSMDVERFSMWRWQLERPDAQYVILTYPDRDIMGLSLNT